MERVTKVFYKKYLFVLLPFLVLGLFTLNASIMGAANSGTATLLSQDVSYPHLTQKQEMIDQTQKFYDFAKQQFKSQTLHQIYLEKIQEYPVEKKMAAYVEFLQKLKARGVSAAPLFDKMRQQRLLRAAPTESMGSISGTVTVEGGFPEGSVSVLAFDEYGFLVAGAYTGFFVGDYTITDLPAGNYYVLTRSEYVDEFYNDVPSVFLTNWRSAMLVNVPAGGAVTGIDFDLLAGAKVTGTFYEEDGTTPIAFNFATFQVTPFNNPTVLFAPSAFTGFMGEYEITIPATGVFKLKGEIFGYQPQYYNQKDNWLMADPIAVATLSDSIPNVDFVLSPEGVVPDTNLSSIEGFVSGEDGSETVLTLVFAFNTADTSIAGIGVTGSALATVLEQGTPYEIPFLPAGTYIVYANDYLGPFAGEYYMDAPTPDLATPLTLTGADTASNVDFSLPFGGGISGTITDEGGTPLDSVLVFAVRLDLENMGKWFTENFDFGVGISQNGGNYQIAGLTDGEYVLRTFSLLSDSAGKVLDEYYENVYNIFEFDQATPVMVSAPNTTTINFQLEFAGSITGNFYEADGTTPITGEGLVIPFNALTGLPELAITVFDSLTAAYTLAPLPTGSFVLLGLAGDTDSVSTQYVPQFYDGVYNAAAATPVGVTAGSATSGINFKMERPGTIQGFVYLDTNFPAGADSVSQTFVVAYDATTGEYRGSSGMTFSGGYRIYGLPPGNYLVEAVPVHPMYAATYVGGGTSFDDPANTPVTVVSEDTTLADIFLESGLGVITGTVFNEDGTMPLGGIGVIAYDPTGHIVSLGVTEGLLPPVMDSQIPGLYAIPGLVAGGYYVRTFSFLRLFLLLSSLNLENPDFQFGGLLATTDPMGVLEQETGFELYADEWYQNVLVQQDFNPFALLLKLIFSNPNFVPLFPFAQLVPPEAQLITVSSPGFTSNINFQLPLLQDVLTGIPGKEEIAQTPEQYKLYPNFPNPFNPETHIVFDLPEASDVTITVFNILGQKVRTLLNSKKAAGRYEVIWNGTDQFGNAVSSGIYILEMKAENTSFTRKMVLMK